MLDKDKIVSLLQERYEIKEILGKGGMGAVFHAWDKFLQIDVAIKVIATQSIDTQILTRFQREAKLSSKLSHKNIITIYDFGLLEDQVPYMVLEYFAGESLDHILANENSISIEKSLPLFIQIAEGLVHAHGKGVVHRDLKPANVILKNIDEDSFEVKILDFGIAKTLESEEEKVLTSVGTIIGSPLYMSPEQTQSAEVDHRSDLYSFGCVMFKTLTGQVPIEGSNAIETMTLKSKQKAPSLADRQVDSNEFLEEILARCLAIEPENRYQSAESLLEDLKELERDILAGEETAVSVQVLPDESKTEFNKWLIPVVVLSLLLVSAGIIITLISQMGITTNPSQTPDVVADSNNTQSFLFEVKPKIWMIVDGAETKDFEELATKSDAVEIQVNELVADSKQYDLLKNLQIDKFVFLVVEPLTTDVIKSISQIPTLKQLSIKDSKFESRETLELITKLPHLERIELVGTAVNDFKITGDDIKLICETPCLNTLIFWGVEIEENAFDYIPDKKFREISLVNLLMKESDLKFLKRMNIYSLGLREISVNPAFIKDLKSCKGLEFIDITGIHYKKTPWEIETVKKLSREFPVALVKSAYGYFKNGLEQKSPSE